MKKLFKSQTSYEILELFISNKNKKAYLSEIAKSLSKDPANVSREIKVLNEEGVINISEKNSKRYY